MSKHTPGPVRTYLCDNHRHGDLGECLMDVYAACAPDELWWFDGSDDVAAGWYCEGCWDGHLSAITDSGGISWADHLQSLPETTMRESAPDMLEALLMVFRAERWHHGRNLARVRGSSSTS